MMTVKLCVILGSRAGIAALIVMFCSVWLRIICVLPRRCMPLFKLIAPKFPHGHPAFEGPLIRTLCLSGNRRLLMMNLKQTTDCCREGSTGDEDCRFSDDFSSESLLCSDENDHTLKDFANRVESGPMNAGKHRRPNLPF